jgi:hypothetical protein
VDGHLGGGLIKQRVGRQGRGGVVVIGSSSRFAAGILQCSCSALPKAHGKISKTINCKRFAISEAHGSRPMLKRSREPSNKEN